MQLQRRLFLLLLVVPQLIPTHTQAQQPGAATQPRACVPIVYGGPCVVGTAGISSPPSPHLDRPEHGLPTTPMPLEHRPLAPPLPPTPPPPPPPPPTGSSAPTSRSSLLIGIILLPPAAVLLAMV